MSLCQCCPHVSQLLIVSVGITQTINSEQMSAFLCYSDISPASLQHAYLREPQWTFPYLLYHDTWSWTWLCRCSVYLIIIHTFRVMENKVGISIMAVANLHFLDENTQWHFLIVYIVITDRGSVGIDTIVVRVSCTLLTILNKIGSSIVAALICIYKFPQGCRNKNPSGFHQWPYMMTNPPKTFIL